ncbi:MAG: small-conductance mechanosensitive channel [Planctomycetota bacterium]|jgi:small-conductance mechanosensitive channel
MSQITSLRWLALVLLLVASAGARGLAQQDAKSTEQPALEIAQTRLAGLSDEQLTDKTGWKPALEMRIGLLQELQDTEAKLAQLPADADAEGQLVDLQSELDRLIAISAPSSSDLQNIDQLAEYEKTSVAAESVRAAAQFAVDEAASSQKAAREELTNSTVREADARQRRAALVGEDELSRYRVQSAELESRAVAARRTYLTSALEKWVAREPVLLLELSVAERKASAAAGALEQARLRAAELRATEEQQARDSAAEVARQAHAEDDPIERLKLRMRAESATLEADHTQQQTQIENQKARIEWEGAQLARHESDREALEKRLKVRSAGSDKYLLRIYGRCEQAQNALENVDYPATDSGSEATQEMLATVLDRQWELRLLTTENTSLWQFLEEMGVEREEEALKLFPEVLREIGLLEALATRQKGLEETEAKYSTVSKLLANREKTLNELEQFIADRMMWTRSAPRINTDTFTGALEELGHVSDLYFSDEFRSHASGRASAQGMSFLGLLLVLLALHFWLRRLRVTDENRAKLGPSLSVLLWGRVLIYAAIPSAAIWIVVGAFELDNVRVHETKPLATFFHLQAQLILWRRIARALIGPKGLAIGKWGVVPEVGAQLNRSIRIATFAGQAFYAPWLVLGAEPFGAVHLTRLLWLPYLAAMATSILLLLRRKGPVVKTWTAPSGLSRTCVVGLGILGVVVLVPILLLDVLGYGNASSQYTTNGLRIFEALFVLMGIYRFLDRGGNALVRSVAGRLSKGESEEKLASRLKAGRALVRMTSTVSILLALAFLQNLWGIGAPTQRLLSAIEVFELKPGVYLTGWEVTLGLAWIIGGHIVVHNLSRLHDRVLVPIIGSGEVGGRYAVLTLVRYALLCLAYLRGLMIVGLDTETLGWLLTGASVGLGFGMQEIVANFISGLILLFEQPIRVGDIITVGTTGGKVDKITIRATVVTNWERQTLIIPNKTFITQNVVNWTRNDQVMRRSLQVRVAYGTNIEEALRLIDGVLTAHPSILEDPPHRIWMQKFGDFGVELDVLFFTAISDGLSTRSDLHAAILNRFKAEGIEIPVITRDVQIAEG